MLKIGKFRSPFSLYGNITVGIGALIVVALIFWYIFIKPGQEHASAVKNEAAAEFSTGRTQSGRDATGAILANNNVEKKYDDVTNQGNNDIRAAEGSGVVVNRAANCAGARAQCMQRGRIGSDSCRAVLESCTAAGY